MVLPSCFSPRGEPRFEITRRTTRTSSTTNDLGSSPGLPPTSDGLHVWFLYLLPARNLAVDANRGWKRIALFRRSPGTITSPRQPLLGFGSNDETTTGLPKLRRRTLINPSLPRITKMGVSIQTGGRLDFGGFLPDFTCSSMHSRKEFLN